MCETLLMLISEDLTKKKVQEKRKKLFFKSNQTLKKTLEQ